MMDAGLNGGDDKANDSLSSTNSPDNAGDHFVSESNYDELLALGQCIGCIWSGNYSPCENPTNDEDVEACKQLQALLEKQGKSPKSEKYQTESEKRESNPDQKSISKEKDPQISNNSPSSVGTNDLNSGPNSQRTSQGSEPSSDVSDIQHDKPSTNHPQPPNGFKVGLTESVYNELQALTTCEGCDWDKNYHPCENPLTAEDEEICQKFLKAQQEKTGTRETNEDANDSKTPTNPGSNEDTNDTKSPKKSDANETKSPTKSGANSLSNESSPPSDADKPAIEKKSPQNSPKNSPENSPKNSIDQPKPASKGPKRSEPNPARSLSSLSTHPSHTNLYDKTKSTTRILSHQLIAGDRKDGKYFALTDTSGVLKDLDAIRMRSMGSIYHQSKSKHRINMRNSSHLDLDRSKSKISLSKSPSRASSHHFRKSNKSITRLKSVNGFADLSNQEVLTPVKPNHDHDNSPDGSAAPSSKNSGDDIHHKIFDQSSHHDMPHSQDNTPRHSDPKDIANTPLSSDNPDKSDVNDSPKANQTCGKDPNEIPDRPIVTESIYDDLVALGKCEDCSWTKNYHPCFEKGDTSGFGPLGDCATINDYFPEDDDGEPLPPRTSEPKHYGCYEPQNDEFGENNKGNLGRSGEPSGDFPPAKKSNPSDATEVDSSKSKKNSEENPQNENTKTDLRQVPRQSQGTDDDDDIDDVKNALYGPIYVSKSTYDNLLARGKLLDPPNP